MGKKMYCLRIIPVTVQISKKTITKLFYYESGTFLFYGNFNMCRWCWGLMLTIIVKRIYHWLCKFLKPSYRIRSIGFFMALRYRISAKLCRIYYRPFGTTKYLGKRHHSHCLYVLRAYMYICILELIWSVWTPPPPPTIRLPTVFPTSISQQVVACSSSI